MDLSEPVSSKPKFETWLTLMGVSVCSQQIIFLPDVIQNVCQIPIFVFSLSLPSCKFSCFFLQSFDPLLQTNLCDTHIS